MRAAWRCARGVDGTARRIPGHAVDIPPSSPHLLSLVRRMSALVPPGKSLREVTHVELLEKEDPDAIVTIWRDYHEGKAGKLGVKLEPDVYRALKQRSAQCPLFVMPLHKSPSQYLTLVLQTTLPYVSFTAIDVHGQPKKVKVAVLQFLKSHFGKEYQQSRMTAKGTTPV